MKLNSANHWLLCVSLSATFAGCKHGEIASEAKVIGGEPAKAGMFPASIHIPNCSAARIGETLILTAAHCVLEQGSPATLATSFKPGDSLPVDYGVKLAEAQRYDVQVLATAVHSTYIQKLDDGGPSTDGGGDAVDVALIYVKGLPAEIGIASTSPTPLTASASVMFTGFGCERLPHGLAPSGDGDGVVARLPTEMSDLDKTLRLKYKEVAFAGYEGSFGYLRNQQDNSELAPLGDGDSADELAEPFSGCPGDSGSAVYVMSESKIYLAIAGVNSYINPVRTAFTRLDQSAPHTVAACLATARSRLPELPEDTSKPAKLCGNQ